MKQKNIIMTFKEVVRIIRAIQEAITKKSAAAAKFGVNFATNLTRYGGMFFNPVFENYWEVECVREGKVIWVEKWKNIIVNEGLDDILDVYLKSGTQTATWYIGLKNSGTPVAGDTMASHAGWTENTTYSETVRQTWTGGTVVNQSVDNSASKASFSINGTTTIYGCLMTSSNVKGGTVGKLYGVGDFSTARAVISGDTLNVTVTCTSAAA